MTSFTENGAVAHKTTCSSIMDLFVNSTRKCTREYVHKFMAKGWKENPELLVKLVCMTRDPRNGKGERDVTYHMMQFLKTFFPNTYKLNAKRIALEYGRLEDLLEFAGLPYKHPKTMDNFDFDSDFEMKLFAEILRADLESKHPSLAVKWAPREKSHFNKYATKLSEIMFPDDVNCKEKYRKEVLKPLSEKVKTVEQLMCSGNWNQIEYSSVPSQAMKIYGRMSSTKWHKNKKEVHESQPGAFVRHDEERFRNYLALVKSGEAKINTTGIQPHQLVKSAMVGEDETIELQWNTLVNKLREVPTIGTSMAVVDVSGSMHGEPMEVAIALGLVIAELANGPFKNKMITFSSQPSFHTIQGETLHQKVTNMSRASWGQSTNVEAVFDLLLTTALTFNIPPENMVETLFIFTDMQFDAANHSNSNTETLFKTIHAKYEKAKYTVPKLVFWNLRASATHTDAFPVTIDENGTAYLSGFSAELLKVFMQGLDFNPMTILTELLSRYHVEIHPNEITKNLPDDIAKA
jgi:hypothetical protein